AVQLNSFDLHCGRRRVVWSMPDHWAFGRLNLDQTLVRQAIAAGAEFLPSTKAATTTNRLSENDCRREVVLQSASEEAVVVSTRVVICADGIGHTSRTPTERGQQNSSID